MFKVIFTHCCPLVDVRASFDADKWWPQSLSVAKTKQAALHWLLLQNWIIIQNPERKVSTCCTVCFYKVQLHFILLKNHWQFLFHLTLNEVMGTSVYGGIICPPNPQLLVWIGFWWLPKLGGDQSPHFHAHTQVPLIYYYYQTLYEKHTNGPTETY